MSSLAHSDRNDSPRSVDVDWLYNAGWGVFCHYLDSGASSTEPSDTTAAQWNRRIESFDVNALAQQLEEVGAPYFFLTLGQNSGHFCSPNQIYDEIVGRRPSLLSERDLIAELATVLNARGIRLGVYLPSGAPDRDVIAIEKFAWKSLHDVTEDEKTRLEEFQTKWEAVIREWSTRWGDQVFAWWLDGVYHADAMYRHADEPNFRSFAAALRAGNPKALLAFNGGVKDKAFAMSHEEDYTAGELDFSLPLASDAMPWAAQKAGRWVQASEDTNVQVHYLTFLAELWGAGASRFSSDLVRGYTEYVLQRGGTITWDVPISNEGQIAPIFIERLKNLKNLKRPSST